MPTKTEIVLGVFCILLLALSATFIALFLKEKGRDPSAMALNQTKAAALQSPFEIIRFELPQGPNGSKPSNLCHFVYKGCHYLVVRYIFYRFDNDEQVHFDPKRRNHNAVFSIGKDFLNLTLLGFIQDEMQALYPQSDMSNGLEDIRIVIHQGSIKAVGNSCQVSKNPPLNQMFVADLLSLDSGPHLDHYQMIDSPHSDRMEKNWIPFVHHNRLVALYQLHPLVLVDLEQEGRFVVYNREEHTYSNEWSRKLKELRGSTTFCTYGKGTLGVFHTCEMIQKKKHYVHHWVMTDDSMRVTHVSSPFTFENVRVEFCMGLALDSQQRNATVFYTLMDRMPSCRTVPLNTISWFRVE